MSQVRAATVAKCLVLSHMTSAFGNCVGLGGAAGRFGGSVRWELGRLRCAGNGGFTDRGAEGFAKRIGSQVAVCVAALKDADDAGFLADGDDNGVAFLGKAEGGAMAATEGL